MKLFYSPIHVFIHKVLIVAHESGVGDQLEYVPVYPYRDGYDITQINPFNKVPTLTLDDGTSLFSSQTIVEYLDSLAPDGHSLYPEAGAARWDALRRLAQGDSTFELTVMATQDDNYGDGPRQQFIDWVWPKIPRALDCMEADATVDRPFDIGDASVLHALSYIDLCIPDYVPDFIPQDFNWRSDHPQLESWFEETITRPSVKSHYNKDYEGDQSPEYCRGQVLDVVRLRDSF